ncbi:unnamed protein product, partial [Urochloa humidicola]
MVGTDAMTGDGMLIFLSRSSGSASSSDEDFEGRDGRISVVIAQTNQVLEDQCHLESPPSLPSAPSSASSTATAAPSPQWGFAYDHLFPWLLGGDGCFVLVDAPVTSILVIGSRITHQSTGRCRSHDGKATGLLQSWHDTSFTTREPKDDQ